ncbi:MAG: hypothetical protein KDC53_09285 [Saprospiraceae bacterium]|nr:hypothetical protein [Saprospiraceae bacterium]
MKRLLFVFVGVMAFLVVSAQPANVQSKPRAKSKVERSVFKHAVTRVNPAPRKGPSAKNYIKRGQVIAGRTSPVVTSARMSLKGPGAKNYQPRIKRSGPDIFRHSSRNE